MRRLDDLVTQCIRCGFCLESCPTFMETGEETEGPRGRIYLVRSAEEGKIAWEDAKPHLDRCLGCRACETACPSGVRYGEILEIARSRVGKSAVKHGLLNGMSNPRLFRLQLLLGGILPGRRIPAMLSRLLSGEAPEAVRPRLPDNSPLPPLDERELPAIRGEAYILQGCVMRVLYPHVNEITKRLLRRVGIAVQDVDQGCCGALHAHNGYLDEARKMRANLERQFPGGNPIVVNSAGCGSWLKESGSGRVFDASEFLFDQGLGEVLRSQGRLDTTIAYHDACHLSHGQGIRSAPRELLASIPGVRLIELPELDMCCGSAGIYNLTKPAMARRLLERKWRNIEATGATIVAMGNPGCHAWIRQAARERESPIEILHTLEVFERALTRR